MDKYTEGQKLHVTVHLSTPADGTQLKTIAEKSQKKSTSVHSCCLLPVASWQFGERHFAQTHPMNRLNHLVSHAAPLEPALYTCLRTQNGARGAAARQEDQDHAFAGASSPRLPPRFATRSRASTSPGADCPTGLASSLRIASVRCLGNASSDLSVCRLCTMQSEVG